MKFPVLPFVKIAAILSFFGIPSCAPLGTVPPAQARRELRERLASKTEPAILFVGNSYSFGVPRAFSQLAASRGKTVRTGHSTHGGWTLARHAKHQPTLRKIRDGRWDVVVFQEESRTPARPPRQRAAAMFPPLIALANEARNHGAIPVLYQTWGRRDGDADLRGDDFHAMTRRLREGYRAASAAAGGLVVIPVGDAWEDEYSAGRGAELFMPDGSHPTAKGDMLTAHTFFEIFFGS